MILNRYFHKIRSLFMLSIALIVNHFCIAQESSYQSREVAGFQVYVNKNDLPQHEAPINSAIQFIEGKLEEIKALGLQPSVEKQLLSINIFLEWSNGSHGTAVYNRSAYALQTLNQSMEKWKAVEIHHVRNFLKNDTSRQPYLIFHELAHGYHDRIGKLEQGMITHAYENAMQLGLYDRMVPNQFGERVYPYARADEREYFAELSVAFLAKNTTYPFISTELEVHDPVGYRMLTTLWRFKIPRD